MHLLVRETRTLDEAEAAVDLAQSPAGLVFVSFSDSDLAAAAAAWLEAPPPVLGDSDPMPGLRLASLARLRHPLSVDLYLERTVSHASAVVLRLLGGMEYWGYGAEELGALCRSRGIALAVVPGCERADPRLAELSTVPEPVRLRIETLLRAGGPENTRLALRLCAHQGGLCPEPAGDLHPVPACGELPIPGLPTLPPGAPLAAIVFYRSQRLAGDIAPITALAAALAERGLRSRALFVASLKDPDAGAFVASNLRAWRPAVVLNATGFSSRGPTPEGPDASPLDAGGVPVLQLVLAGIARDAWAASPRGLGPSDLAMQVALPELDGRLATAAISFKREERIEALDFTRRRHEPDLDGIAIAADRAAGWARLSATPVADRRIALVLPDAPGTPGQVGHAVGLDTPASLAAILQLLRGHGYDAGADPQPDARTLAALLCRAPATAALSLERYRALLPGLPAPLREAIHTAWGDPAADPSLRDGAFAWRHLSCGRLLLAVQPDRGGTLQRRVDYHDPALPPCHGYVAFHLWLTAEGTDAMVMLGAHGTLEWLPGKPVAPSAACAPIALIGSLPVIYPFVVNNPGEAAVARRRLGAVTIGHLTPPLRRAGLHGEAATLERLIDEYATADGMDPRRTALLRREILRRAESCGLLAECADTPPSTPGSDSPDPDMERLARLDAYLCDVKELQIRDGLHVFARSPTDPLAWTAALLEANPAVDPAVLRARLAASPPAEAAALLAALDGRFIQPGPGGAPSRGRADVLPTGRNITSIDPRGLPTRTATALAETAADALLRRHLQDHGDWPRSLVVDLWGSSALRTGGEDLAMAMLLLGVRPIWDADSGRVTGTEITPLALLDRPRIDVTLRISGLFRDAFEAQLALFDAAVQAVAARDEAIEWNPLAAATRGLEGAARHAATARIYGPAAGHYGTGVQVLLDAGAWDSRDALGQIYLAASDCAWGPGRGAADRAGFSRRVADADAFVHLQDHAETDLLDGPGVAAHTGGFAAAAGSLGATPALYHLDTAQPGDPRARSIAEEVARVVRGRAANPDWVRVMTAHGYRGAAEIARSLDALFAFAATLPERFDRQFDLVFDATLGDAATDAVLSRENPDARASLAARFDEALSRGLWRPARNNVAAVLGAAIPEAVQSGAARPGSVALPGAAAPSGAVEPPASAELTGSAARPRRAAETSR